MGVAADCSYVATYGSQENAASQILTNWNSASSLYKVCRSFLFNCWIFCHTIYRTHSTLLSGLPNSKFEMRC